MSITSFQIPSGYIPISTSFEYVLSNSTQLQLSIGMPRQKQHGTGERTWIWSHKSWTLNVDPTNKWGL